MLFRSLLQGLVRMSSPHAAGLHAIGIVHASDLEGDVAKRLDERDLSQHGGLCGPCFYVLQHSEFQSSHTIAAKSASGEQGPEFRETRALSIPSITGDLPDTSGALSTVIGFLFAYCASYVKMKWKSIFNLIAMLPIVSPSFAVALSIILLFGSRGLITYTLLGMRDVNVYGFRGLSH